MDDVSDTTYWFAHDLGKPIPDSEHAVSVCLPLWKHNVAYEEGEQDVVEKMRCGYPRFFLHPNVCRLFEQCERRFAQPGERCFAFPSKRVAERCLDFVAQHTGHAGTIHDFDKLGLFAVCLPGEATATAKSFWQHTGDIVSSRLARVALEPTERPEASASTIQHLRERVAGLTGGRADDVFLFPTGMAAVSCAFRALSVLRPEQKSVQFGFPYVDTLKLLQQVGPGVHFFPRGSEDELDDLAALLRTEKISALFCEVPGNPLLNSPDLVQLRALANRHDFPIVVDDTLGAFINLKPLPAADIVVSSLTKFFSGQGNVMGGSLVLNPNGPFYERLKSIFGEEYEDLLFSQDAEVLERNSHDVETRVKQINRTTERLCDMLSNHRAVRRVDYPKYRTPENYRAFLQPGGGFGGLFSVQLENAAEAAPRFYDALRICKGPNLGTNFSLCCPFTILAHYEELDFVESCGISRYLLRFSVGLEDAEVLLQEFTRALDVLS